MSNRGRFGKYGEIKRMDRLRQARTHISCSQRMKNKRFKSKSFIHKPFQKRGLIQIVSAKRSHAEYIAYLSGRVFDIYGPYGEIIPRWFESETTKAIIAKIDDQSVGFAMIGSICDSHKCEDTFELLAIAVEPGKQGIGIGNKLMQAIEHIAVQSGIKNLCLHTASANLAGRRLFTKNGYRIVEIKPRFYPKKQDAAFMFKELLQIL